LGVKKCVHEIKDMKLQLKLFHIFLILYVRVRKNMLVLKKLKDLSKVGEKNKVEIKQEVEY